MSYSINGFPDKIKKVFKEWNYQPSNYKEADGVFKAYHNIDRHKPLKLKAENFDEKNPKYIVIDDNSFPIVSNEVWKQMDDSQKLNLTYKIFDYFCKMYQVQNVKYNFIPIDESVFVMGGYYIRDINEIFINPDQILSEKCEPYFISDVILHEITHAKHYQFLCRNKDAVSKSNNKFEKYLMFNSSASSSFAFEKSQFFTGDFNLYIKVDDLRDKKSWQDFLSIPYRLNPTEHAAVNKGFKLLNKLKKLYPDDFKDEKMCNEFERDVNRNLKYYNFKDYFNKEYGFNFSNEDVDILCKIDYLISQKTNEYDDCVEQWKKHNVDNNYICSAELVNKKNKIVASILQYCKTLVDIFENKAMVESDLIEQIKKEVVFDDDKKEKLSKHNNKQDEQIVEIEEENIM